MSNSKGYAGYVDENYLLKASEIVKPLKQKSYELMNISSGHNVLDVGCAYCS
jgi:ubiquinone/menaquinone biosynthesis C-methylase UbiE